MLACYFARALGMEQIVVPVTPGVLSALGGLIADTKNDFVKTTYYDLDAASLAQLRDDGRALDAAARAWLAGETGADASSDARVSVAVSADMRYKGQSFEIDTPLDMAWLETQDIGALSDAFHREHARLYGHSDARAKIQVVALRLVIASQTPKPALRPIAASDEPPAPDASVTVWMDGAFRDAALFHRSKLLAGQRLEGPAVIAQDDCTTCVLPGFSGEVDAYGNLILTQVRANAN
jgi:N-methylhydantoinase A